MERAKKEQNNHKQEFKGKNLEEVIGNAEHVLMLSRDKINYEIVAEKTSLFGKKKKEIVIVAWPKTEQEKTQLSDFLNKSLSILPFDIDYHVKRRDGIVYVIFEGDDNQLFLRKEAALLMAFQHLLNKIFPEKVQVDCDFYRKRKERQLKEYSRRIAQQVFKSGEDEILDTMNPYERRIVHIAVNQVPGISSESLGDGFFKKVKIFPLRNQTE